MKRFIYIAILMTICGITAMAQDRPDITHQTGGDDRVKFNIVNDKPTLDYNNDTQEIIVVGSDSDYYNVTISESTSHAVILESVIDGVYDIIDVSMLTSGSYNISLTSSHWNTYTWTFENGQVTNHGFMGVNGLKVKTREGSSLGDVQF